MCINTKTDYDKEKKKKRVQTTVEGQIHNFSDICPPLSGYACISAGNYYGNQECKYKVNDKEYDCK